MALYQTTPAWLFSTASLLGCILVLLPLPFHIKNLNTGTSLYIIWTSLGCLVFFVNSIVWRGNAIDWAPVWCDISTRILVGLAVAIPSASLCISRRLYYIASTDTVVTTLAMKKRMVYADLSIALGIPTAQMVVQYIVQGHRYDIFEDIGCYPTTYTTWVSIVLVSTWPIVIGCLSGVFCVMSLLAFNERRRTFNELLAKSAMNLTHHSYFRLMALACGDLLCTVPLGIWALVFNVTNGVNSWISWDNVHAHFSRIRQYPAIEWKTSRYLVVAMEMDRWLVVFCAVIFVLFFAFTKDARQNYRDISSATCRRFGIPVPAWFSDESSLVETNSGSSGSTYHPHNNDRHLPSARGPMKKKSDPLDFDDDDVDLQSISDANTFLRDREAKAIRIPVPAGEPSYDSLDLKDVSDILSSNVEDVAQTASSSSSALPRRPPRGSYVLEFPPDFRESYTPHPLPQLPPRAYAKSDNIV